VFPPAGQPAWGDGGRGLDSQPPAEPPWGELLGYEGDGWPPGYIGWSGVPMGELSFDLFDLVGPGDTDPSVPECEGFPYVGAESRQACAGPTSGPSRDGTGSPLADGAGMPRVGVAGPPVTDHHDPHISGDLSCAGSPGVLLPPPAEPMLSAVLGVAAMGDDDCLGLMARAARAVARWQAVLVRAQARFAELRPPLERGDDYSEFAADEIAPVLGVSPGSAAHRLSSAFTLATRLPATLDALEAGLIDYGRAMALVEVTRPLSDAHARAVEDTVLAGGGRPSHSAFRQAARRAALKVDPEGAEQRRRDAKADRCVTTRPMEDGAAELGVKLPAELTGAIYDRIDGLARRAAGPDEPRTMDQLRADTAADLLLGTNREHLAVEVHVTVPLTTLLGLSADPGDLEGYGPIPAELARELAQNATWRRIVTDPVDGTVLDVGRRRYPSAALARHVQERDHTCRFPGCSRKARKSDLDHTQRHVDGGATHDGQLSALCRHHHRLKDEEKEPTGWSLTQPIPGHLEWISPTGRVYRVGPTPADHDPPHAPSRKCAGAGSPAGAGDSGGTDYPATFSDIDGTIGSDGGWPLRPGHGLGDHPPGCDPWSPIHDDPPF
jgi:hypothetical protein